MKLLAALLLIGVTSAPAFAGGPRTGYRSNSGWAEEEKCYRTEYSEEYVPGTSKFPGYVKTRRQKFVFHVDIEDMFLTMLLILDMKNNIPTWVIMMTIPVRKEQ